MCTVFVYCLQGSTSGSSEKASDSSAGGASIDSVFATIGGVLNDEVVGHVDSVYKFVLKGSLVKQFYLLKCELMLKYAHDRNEDVYPLKFDMSCLLQLDFDFVQIISEKSYVIPISDFPSIIFPNMSYRMTFRCRRRIMASNCS